MSQAGLHVAKSSGAKWPRNPTVLQTGLLQAGDAGDCPLASWSLSTGEDGEVTYLGMSFFFKIKKLNEELNISSM